MKKVPLKYLVMAVPALALWMMNRGNSGSSAEHEPSLWEGVTADSPEGRALITKYWATTDQPFLQDIPWSGAFIHHVAPGLVMTAGSHMLYAGAALQGRGDYRVHRSQNFPVKPGDIILKNRGGGNLHFGSIGQGHADSHGDVITAIAPGVARAIGGNKAHGVVGVENYSLASDGSISTPGVFAILRKA